MDPQTVYIAIADDHPMVRDGMANLLVKFDIETVIQAEDGLDLLRQLKTAERLPDVCVLDVDMPEMNGFETQVALLKEFPEMKTLVLSVHASESFTIRMMAAGAKGYLKKNAKMSEIATAIRAIHDDGIYHSAITNTHILKSIHNDRNVLEFSEKEMQVLNGICAGYTLEEIAEQYGFTSKTAIYHRNVLYQKLGVSKNPTLVLYAVQLGLIKVEASLSKHD